VTGGRKTSRSQNNPEVSTGRDMGAHEDQPSLLVICEIPAKLTTPSRVIATRPII
jgi:hypothetical protein